MKQQRIYLCGSLSDTEQQSWQTHLRVAMPLHQWSTEPHPDTTIAVIANPPAGSLQNLPKLEFIQSLWAGVDRVIADPTIPSHIPIARLVDPVLTQAMIETAQWAVLSVHRGFFHYRQQQEQQKWQQLIQTRSQDFPITVLGHGVLGQAVADALSHMGYPITVWRKQDNLHLALAKARAVINLLPLTKETRGIINLNFLNALPKGAALINLARGAHLVDADVLQALETGQLAHAVLDVFVQEPLPTDHPFWTHPKITVLPHIAALSDQQSAAQLAAQNIQRWLNGATPLFLLKRELGY